MNRQIARSREHDHEGHYMIEGRSKISLMEEEWDQLVILDACRYDYFEKTFREYLDGKLQFALSCASDTREWMRRVFRDKYNEIVYVSANPHINSKGVDVANIGLDPGAYFYKIVDVWDSGWDEYATTIPPEKVNDAAVAAKLAYPDKRLIIHYFQPHAPYLCLVDYAPESVLPYNDLGVSVSFLRNSVIRGIWSALSRDFGLLNRIVSKIRQTLTKWAPLRPIDAELRKVGKAGVLKAYENDLRRVLGCVSKLLENLPGKTVITSDHGELLGERNEWGHRPYHHVRELIRVPYLECATVNQESDA